MRFPGFRSIALLLLMGAGASIAHADNYAFGFSPATGDAWFDAQLGDINVLTTGNLDGFVDEVVVSHGAPRPVVQELVLVRHYPPDYVWLAAATANELGRDWDDVFPVFERNRGRGWGVIARELGIAPGSPAFHALKGDVGRHNGKWKAKKDKAAGGPPPGRGPDKAKGPKGKGKNK